MRAQRLAEHSLPLYAPKRNAGNDYDFDQAEQDTLTYTGMGPDINVHDQWACESPGTIRDRTKEHLGSTDKAITAHRRMLMGAIKKLQNDENLPGGAAGLSGPIAVDAIGATDQQDEIWRGVDAARRAACPWDAGL
jgi:hypothetical protein